MTMLLIRVAAYVLVATVASIVACSLASVPVPPAPRLGYRGAERHKALTASAVFAAIEPFLRYLAGLLSRMPLGKFRETEELELRRAGHFLGLTIDEYLALSLLSALGLGATVELLAKAAGMEGSLF